MPADTVLLIVIAVCCVLITLVVVMGGVVLARTAAGLDRTKARVDKIIGDVDRETGATLDELRGTVRGIGDLSWVLKRLAEEAVVGMVGRSLRRSPAVAEPPRAEPSANLSAVHAGIDTAFRVVGMVGRSLRRSTAVAEPPRAEPSADLSAVHAGIDTAFRVVELWQRIRANREARADSAAHNGSPPPVKTVQQPSSK